MKTIPEQLIHSFPGNSDSYANEYGLTKREYFAAMALQGILAGKAWQQSESMLAFYAVELADELIEKLNEN